MPYPKLFLCLLTALYYLSIFAQNNQSSGQSLYPPGEEGASAALDKSPRHGEWVDIPYDGKTSLRSWISYPERSDKAPVVVIIHEIFGLSDWIRSVADQFASEGFIAVAPDFISGYGPNGGGSASVSTRDSVVMLIRNVSAEETYKRLDAALAFAAKIPSANGKIATVGFCWGGGRSFGYACIQPKLSAAIVYYGVSPDSTELVELNVPVLGLYGGDDARVGATVPPAYAEVKSLGKTYEYEMFDGAGHGFLRDQSGRDGANLRATQKAWPRMLAFLKKYF
jgi:carboxymethylenebutenolidase